MIDEPHDFVLLEDEYLDAAYELREIAAVKRQLLEREADCKRIIEKVLTVGERGIAPDGEQLVFIRAGARVFKPALAADLPAEYMHTILSLQPDVNLAREVLPEDMYEACCEYNKASVVVI